MSKDQHLQHILFRESVLQISTLHCKSTETNIFSDSILELFWRLCKESFSYPFSFTLFIAIKPRLHWLFATPMFRHRWSSSWNVSIVGVKHQSINLAYLCYINVPNNGLCSTKTRLCQKTNIFSIFYSENVYCKFQHFTVSQQKYIATENIRKRNQFSYRFSFTLFIAIKLRLHWLFPTPANRLLCFVIYDYQAEMFLSGGVTAYLFIHLFIYLFV
jgi:Holliday junction resolvase